MTINVHNRILMTGAAGNLGKALRDRLKANCNVLRLSDRAEFGPAGDREEVVLADLSDADAVHSMMQGVDAVVHFGGVSTESPFAPILIGVYNLYESARKQGVKRVVFASSNHVTGFYRQSETITTDKPARPDGLYGLSKAFGEDISRMYFDRYGIETACVRIGSSFPEPRDRRMLATWLSFDDLHRLITACLTTPVLAHTIIFGMWLKPECCPVPAIEWESLRYGLLPSRLCTGLILKAATSIDMTGAPGSRKPGIRQSVWAA